MPSPIIVPRSIPIKSATSIGSNCDPAMLTADIAGRDKLPQLDVPIGTWYWYTKGRSWGLAQSSIGYCSRWLRSSQLESPKNWCRCAEIPRGKLRTSPHGIYLTRAQGWIGQTILTGHKIMDWVSVLPATCKIMPIVSERRAANFQPMKHSSPAISSLC